MFNYKKWYSPVLAFLFILIANIQIYATDPYCQNLGFELGDFTNWTGCVWQYNTYYGTPISTPKNCVITPTRFSIMTDQYSYDENTGYKLKLIPPGFKYSAQIGNIHKNAYRQSLSYKLHVDDINSLLIVHFAVVFEAPHKGHEKEEEPRFTITFYDENKKVIPNCANYDVYSSDSRIGGFNTYVPPVQNQQKDTIYWRDWTAVGLNLTPYKGKEVTVEFMAADCSRTGHYGYAYVVGECMPMRINVGYCALDNKAVLYAPKGFIKYRWLKNGTQVGIKDTFVVDEPIEGEVYQCELTSETGCVVTLDAVIKKYEPKAIFTSTFDCSTNTVLFKNNSTVTNGTIDYEWNFGDGSTSTEKDPLHIYKTFGPKTVKLTVKNPPSTCVDTMTQIIYTFERQKVRIEGNPHYCLGTKTTLYGKDAYTYKWSTGETTDSIKVGTPGRYWVVGYSKDGTCNSEPFYYDVSPYPDWTLDIQGTPYFCKGSNTVLTATGAVQYLWSTKETTDKITIDKAGDYTVIGINENGCVKQKNIHVRQIELPKVDFSLSADKVGLKKPTITTVMVPESNVTYTWDMGDGTQLTGSSVTHQYTIDYKQWKFPIKLKAVNEYGCESDTTKQITLDFFVPNVFTPNGDGVNDIFMPDVDLKVMSRTGLVMYEGTGGWDGNYKGKKADNDTYFYFIRYKDGDNTEQLVKGYIMLKR